MAKIRDLGINVIPETMRPPEIGAGGCGISLADNCCPNSCAVTTVNRGLAYTPVCCPATCYVTTVVYATACCPNSCNVTTLHQTVVRNWIGQLKEQFQQQIAQLEEYEKTLGPRTAEEIDAREKELNAELAQLAARRKELKKK